MDTRSHTKIPKTGMLLLKLMIPGYDFDYVIGFYEKEYTDILASRGRIAAWSWFWFQIARSAPVLLTEKLFWSIVMLKNYLKISVRNICKQKLNSALNIAGLSLGIACALLIIFHVRDELSYDRGFPKGDRIYRIISENYGEGSRDWAAVSPLHGLLIRNDIPEIEQTARFYYMSSRILSYTPERGAPRQFEESRGYYADPTAIGMFDLKFVHGDPSNSLRAVNTIIMTEKTARKYFGDENPVGRTIDDHTDGRTYTITGVFREFPFRTHLQIDYLVSMSTLYTFLSERARNSREWKHFYTYVLLNKNATLEQADAKVPDFMANFHAEFGTREEILARGRMQFQPITDIHLHSHLEQEMHPNSDIAYVYIFLVIAVFILLIAAVNFVNISTSQAFRRMKEVGVRKVFGADRRQLTQQFLGESFVLTAAAAALAVLLLYLALPAYNNISGKEFEFHELITFYNCGLLLAIAGIIGMLAGAYPALFMAGFKPAYSFRGLKNPGSAVARVRKGLVIFQFTASVFMIFSTIIIYRQMEYFQTRDLGFDKERIIAVSLYGDLRRNFRKNMEALKQEFLNHSGISHVTTVSDLPGQRFSVENLVPEGMPEDTELPSVRYLRVDRDFIETMGINIVEGRSFKDISESSKAFIVNETLARAYKRDDLIGTTAINPIYGDVKGKIVGIAKDFNFASLHNKVEPLVLDLWPGRNHILLVKIEGGSIPETISFLKQKVNEIAPGHLFMYSFVDDNLNRLYAAEEIVNDVFRIFAALAIFISCMGLFGLSAYYAELRIKEIGVRKVLGASIPNVVFTLNRQFLLWVIAASVIALPAGWYAMNMWLQNFAFRISIGWPVFVYTVLFAFVVALVTVSYQSVKAARANPVNSLRHE